MKEQRQKEEVEWDKKKIFLFLIAAIILVIVGFQVKTLTLGENASKPQDLASSNKSDVKGKSTKVQSPAEDIKKNIQNEINSLKNEASNINLIEIASSSAQVQKVINDLKALQDYPSNQIKEVCEKVCSGL